MPTYAVSGDKLTAIAEAIRNKTEQNTQMSIDDMPTQIAAIDSTKIVSIKGAMTATSVGYTIDTGVHPANLPQFTVFFAFDSDYSSVSGDNYSLCHGMYEASPYPGFTIDLNSGNINGRFAVGTERITNIFGSPVNTKRNKIAFTYDNGTLRFFSARYPNGYTFATKCTFPQPTISFVLGAIKKTDGTFARYTKMTDVNFECFTEVKSDAVCIKFVTT